MHTALTIRSQSWLIYAHNVHALVALPFAWLGYVCASELALGSWFPIGFIEGKLLECLCTCMSLYSLWDELTEMYSIISNLR